MSLIITSKKFKAANWYNADNGTDYINGCIGDKTILTLEGYFEKTILDVILSFSAADKTITLANNIDFRSFIETTGYQVGETIIVPDAVSNNTELTITAISDRVITVSEVLVDEKLKGGNIYLTSKPEAIDFYYNIVNVNPNERKHHQNWIIVTPTKREMISNIDPTLLQKYAVIKGFDCEDTMTTVYFSIATDKYDWVTDTLAGSVSQTSIIGMGLVDYKQKFKIIHTFYQAPLWTKDSYPNYLNRRIPDNYLKDQSPTYIFGIEAKYDWFNTEPAISYLDQSTTGRTAWFNQNIYKNVAEYYFDSITYTDADTSDELDKLDVNKSVDVSITIKSKNGLFDSGSKFILNFIYGSLDEQFYQNLIGNATKAERTLRQNNVNDIAIITEGGADVDGEFFGTAYQVITGANVSLTNDTTAVITFNAEFSTTIKAFIATFSTADLNYAFTVSTQDISGTSSAEIDRVNVLCDFQNMDIDLRNPGLLDLVDHFYCVVSPNDEITFSTISDFEGKRCYVEVPFTIDTADEVPLLMECGIEIYAYKAGKEDFILERKIIKTSQYIFTDNTQVINFSEGRGYKIAEDSPYNLVTLSNDASFDSGYLKGYVIHYPFVLRDEYWQTNPAVQPGVQYDIQKDIAEITNRWADLQDEGWTLKIRFVASVKDSTGFITDYEASTDLNIIKSDEISGDDIDFTKETFYLDEDNIRVDSLIKNGKTKIITVFTPVDAQVTAEVVEPTAAATTHYEFTLPKNSIIEGSASFTRDETFTDNGDGTLTGDAGGTGTIDYDTGDVVLDFFAAPTFPANILGTYQYNPLGNVLYPTSLFGLLLMDKPTSGGPNKRISISTKEDNSLATMFAPTDANGDATESWATDQLRINVFGKVSVSVETIYTDESGTFGNAACDESGGTEPTGPGGIIIVITVGGVVTSANDVRQWEDGDAHTWEDNSPADWE